MQLSLSRFDMRCTTATEFVEDDAFWALKQLEVNLRGGSRVVVVVEVVVVVVLSAGDNDRAVTGGAREALVGRRAATQRQRTMVLTIYNDSMPSLELAEKLSADSWVLDGSLRLASSAAVAAKNWFY